MASERKFVAENIRRVLLKEFLMKEVSRAGFGGLDVQRTPMGTRVVLSTERPGLVIGRRGQTINQLTRDIEDKFGFENPGIEVVEVANPNLSAQIMAEKLAFSLERGWHFRRAGHSTVRRIMESGARGCQVVIAGKLTGQRHRTEKFKDGYIKFCGEPKIQFIEHGFTVARLKQGVIGLTVEIMAPGAVLPADITVASKAEAALALPHLYQAEEDLDDAADKDSPVEPEIPEDLEQEDLPAEDEKAPKAVKKKPAKPADEKVVETVSEESSDSVEKKAPKAVKKKPAKAVDEESPDTAEKKAVTEKAPKAAGEKVSEPVKKKPAKPAEKKAVKEKAPKAEIEKTSEPAEKEIPEAVEEKVSETVKEKSAKTAEKKSSEPKGEGVPDAVEGEAVDEKGSEEGQ